MQKKSIQEIQTLYNLELDKAITKIKSSKPKITLLQFPEGLKPYAQTITDYLESKTNSQFMIWLDTCFGACDVPQLPPKKEVDLIIQFGHSKWKFN